MAARLFAWLTRVRDRYVQRRAQGFGRFLSIADSLRA